MKTINGFVLSGDISSQKLVLQACIPFIELGKHAVFSYMRDPNENPYKTDDEDDKTERNKFYQRRIDKSRISKIKEFIRSAILDEVKRRRAVAVFPTAMILSYTNDNTDYAVGDIVSVQLPHGTYIVDGQHRLYAMQKLYEDVCGIEIFASEKNKENSIVKEYIEKYRFNCTILLNFDLWEQSQVFVEVNFNQRKVSKSLYYDIYGMYYNDSYVNDHRNYIYVAHMLAKYMNQKEDSPLKGKIKMLGNSIGLVSQSCFAESIISNMSSRMGIWRIDVEDLTGKPSYKYMAMELKAFYQVVKDVFVDIWPDDSNHKSIICKTTGISSMIRLLGYIHQNILSDNIRQSLRNADDSVINEYKTVVKLYLMKLYYERHRLFGLNGTFSKTGGKGIEKSLYREMCKIISTKLDDLSSETLSAMENWAKLNIDSIPSLHEEQFKTLVSLIKKNNDTVYGFMLAEVLKKEHSNWSSQKIEKEVSESMDKINISLG